MKIHFIISIAIRTIAYMVSVVNGIQTTHVFEVAYYWHILNFTWPSAAAYEEAVSCGRYIPSNNLLTGIKVYQDTFYISLPRIFPGTPVTLAALKFSSPMVNPLLQPYPSWRANVGRSCRTLQNVYSMEIDTKGIMWVLDGVRFNHLTDCPPKIVLLDLKSGGSVIQSYEVPTHLSPHQGGCMNDLVIDESDGGYAYIAEMSNQDPGIIIYSRHQNKGWKIRDRTMFAEMEAVGFTVRGAVINGLYTVEGVALAPENKKENVDRLFYYCPLTGYSLFALSTRILKDKALSSTSDWRKYVQYIGRKPGPSDGMIVDNEGNLYFGLLDNYGIARWNIYSQPFSENVQVVYQNFTTVDWPDTFGMDTYGNLYLTSNQMERILNVSASVMPMDGIRFKILRCYTGTKSYMYS